jgi:signal transduction histidine kinase
MLSFELPANAPAAPAPGRTLLRLTAGLAHTVNNALTGTIGYLELALRQTPNTTNLFRDLEAALSCAHQAAEAVRQVVAFAHMPAHVPSEPVSLREVAAAAARTASACASHRVRIATCGERAARVAGRSALLSAAVEQIVRNALEALPDGGRLSLETEEVGNRCRMWIRDSGPGLPEEVQRHLFEPFVTTKTFPHLGLGLALAAELVRAQDGSLTLSSSPGLGTTVLFTFAAAGAEDAEARPSAKRGESVSRGSAERRSLRRALPGGKAN